MRSSSPAMLRLLGGATLLSMSLLLSACCGGGSTTTEEPTVSKKKEEPAEKMDKKEEKADDEKAEPCGRAFRDEGGKSFTCECSTDQINGSVWGTDIYTSDSSICAAARHAGVIKKSGGVVKVKKAAGCPSYVGTERNGVTTGKWGSYDTSYYFPEKGDGECAKTGGGDACKRAFRDMDGSTFTCNCSADQIGGSIWGTDIYTSDSSICAAARHVGLIGKDGGEVTAKKTQGCSGYVGTERNGVTTGKWGSYDTSYYFPKKGDGACAK